jgi:hypothetical protein
MSLYLSFTKPGESTIADFLSWSLPKYFNESTTPALKQSIYASITNFYGGMARDRSIQIQSREPYIAAVRGLYKRIIQAVKVEHAMASELEIFASILLMLYELRNGEIKDGWIQHGRGAGKLLLTRRPEPRQTRLGNALVQFARYSMVR